VIASVVIDLPHALLSVAREVREKRFTGRVIRLGGAEDVVSLVVNPALAGKVPATATAAIDSVQALMLKGQFSAPRAAFKDSVTTP
jgi:basic membrane lipoprotein Med (substrate-binding protein (PBP1-ABC) superfamily)